MATQSSSKAIDLQKVITEAAKLEVKALLAGVESMQVWLSQAAKFSTIASDTLRAVQDDKGSWSETVSRLSKFGRENTEVFGDLSARLSKSYYDELGRITGAIEKATNPVGRGKAGQRRSPAGRVSRRKAARRKKAAARA